MVAIIMSYFCQILAPEFKVKGKHTDTINELKKYKYITNNTNWFISYTTLNNLYLTFFSIQT